MPDNSMDLEVGEPGGMGRLGPMDELALMDAACKQHGEDMKRACGCDPMDGMSDPIDGVPRSHPNDLEEPAVELPDLL